MLIMTTFHTNVFYDKMWKWYFYIQKVKGQPLCGRTIFCTITSLYGGPEVHITTSIRITEKQIEKQHNNKFEIIWTK